jgi:hypothetical protein
MIVNGSYNKLDYWQLLLQNSEDVESGIYQKVYLVDTVSHSFYIYVSATGIAKLVEYLNSGKLLFIAKKEQKMGVLNLIMLDILKLEMKSIFQ